MTEPDQTEFDILAIADGVTEDGHLRISLSVSPNLDTPDDTLKDWPKKVEVAARKLTVRLDNKDARVTSCDVSHLVNDGPTRLWRQTFPGCKHLREALSSDDGASPEAEGSAAGRAFLSTSGLQAESAAPQRVDLWSPLLAAYALPGSQPMNLGLLDEKGDDENPLAELDAWLALHQRAPYLSSHAAPTAAPEADTPGGATSGVRKSLIGGTVVAQKSDISGEDTPVSALDVAMILSGGTANLRGQAEHRKLEQVFAKTVGQMFKALGMENGVLPERRDESGEGITNETDADRARRMLVGLTSYPTLARYVGLCVDLTVEVPDELKNGTEKTRDVTLLINGKNFVARIIKTDDRVTGFFPCPKKDSVLVDGGVNLNAVIRNPDNNQSGPRYNLGLIDGVKATLAMQYRAANIYDLLASGADRKDIDISKDDIEESGITLFDVDRRSEMESQEKDSPDTFYAEDLLRGLRVDCRLVSQNPDARRWRPLFGRHITYTSDVARDLEAWAEEQKATSHRDEGFSQPGEVTNGKFSHVPLEVIQWSGESLGLPPPRPDEMGDEAAGDRAADIPVDRVLSPPGAREQRPPPLRFGRTYHIGARPCYVNGCGPTIEQVQGSNLYDGKYLEILYERVGRVRPPTVLLPTDCRLFTANAPPPGETPTRLVVKSIVEGQATEYRVVVPGSVAFETAEQYGQFDDRVGITEDIPSGAFNRRKPWLLMDETGGFPVALGAGRRRLSRKPVDGDPEADVRPGKLSRGLVAEFRATDKNTRFYPDSRARLLHFTATLDMTSQALEHGVEDLQFWDEKSRPRDAKPVVIRAVAARRRDKELVKIKNGRKSAHDADAPGLHSWDFHLQPATRVMVDLYCSPTGSPDKDLMGFVKAGKVLNPAAQSVTRIELVHAVRRPLEAPQIPKQTDLAVFISSGAGEIEKNIENGTTAFFEGKCKIHGRSTGRLRFDARWEEHGPEYLGRKDGKWLYRPADRKDLLFRDDRVRQAGDEYLIQAKAASYSFQDGRARRLDIDVVATSAFTEFYEPSDKPDAFETRSATPHSLVVPCSFAPPEPDHERALPVPRWRSWRNTAGTRFRVELKWAIRVFFGSNYKATGFGEKIALVLENRKVTLTEWGGDPIDLNGGRRHKTPILAFDEGPEYGQPLQIWLRKQLILDALLYEPKIDPHEGPFIDIALSARDVDVVKPFLKLGLCRYQPNSVKEQWNLSPCKPRWVSVPPWRLVEVTVTGKKVAVNVKGPTYNGRTGVNGWTVPKLRVRVFKLQFEQWQGVPWKDPPLVPVMVTRNDNSRIPLASEVAPAANGYCLKLELPKSLNQERYVLLLEEREFFAGDPTVSAEAWPLETVVEKDGGSPIVGRIIFQRTIKLGREAGMPRDPDFDEMLRKERWGLGAICPDAHPRGIPP